MEITQASGDMISIGDALITAFMGYALVFFGMILLILVIVIVNKIIRSVQARNAENAAKEQLAAAEGMAVIPIPAPGSAGEIKLYNVSERDAAMIMAITANKLGKPLNELRFLSIKEIVPEVTEAESETGGSTV